MFATKCIVCYGKVRLNQSSTVSIQKLVSRLFFSSPEVKVPPTSFTSRSHTCGNLQLSDKGKQVTICGWLQHQRLDQFLILRDWDGVTQVIIPEDKRRCIPNLSLESVIQVQGVVQERPIQQKNPALKTGDIEIKLEDLTLLNPCKPKLPFNIQDFHKVKESLRMEYRYLDLRNTELQRNLRLRSQLVWKVREFLCKQHGFVDVETPTLFRKTPGGAKEFVVPCRHPGQFYSLPQSPQQFKQLLMVGGIDRYVQIARCYRDEGSKPDRQPEFTQVDIEMSFVEADDVMSVIEQTLHHCWPSEIGVLNIPFPRMSYEQAMTKYGVDKPDTRFSMTIHDVSTVFNSCEFGLFSSALISEDSSVQAINIKSLNKCLTNSAMKQLKRIAKEEFEQDVMFIRVTENGNNPQLPVDTFEHLASIVDIEPEDVICLAVGAGFTPHSALGKLRLECVDILEQHGFPVRSKQDFNFLWVVDFPLFLPKADGGLESAHHPFTAPRDEDGDLLYSNPKQVRSKHYDLVLNGCEIGGGSIRIHSAQQQKYILQHILKEDTSELNHLLEALECGCPPHGGIALGLDRLLCILCGTPSIRDVIAFPKSHDGKDLTCKAPTTIPQQQLDDYHIQINISNT